MSLLDGLQCVLLVTLLALGIAGLTVVLEKVEEHRHTGVKE